MHSDFGTRVLPVEPLRQGGGGDWNAPQLVTDGAPGLHLLLEFIAINVALGLFNLIPVPPLDGSRIVEGLLPSRLRGAWETFARFARSVPFFGAAILGLDDPNVQEIRPLVSRRVVTFGLTPQADVTVRDLVLERTGSRFVATAGREFMGHVALKVPGLHNVKNALAALAVARELSIPFGIAARALEEFAGCDVSTPA